jgi:hypothetical protein
VKQFGHKQSAALIAALKAAGWLVTASKFPGNAIVSHPLSGTEIPSPSYMHGSRSWPFETYYKLRQVVFNFDGERITAVWTREVDAPWVGERGAKVSFKRAIEFVEEEWKP